MTKRVLATEQKSSPARGRWQAVGLTEGEDTAPAVVYDNALTPG
jgi:hypothetical protein